MPAYNIVNPGSMQAGLPEDVSQVLANFQALASLVNGGLDNYNIAAGAAIDQSKLVFNANLTLPATLRANEVRTQDGTANQLVMATDGRIYFGSALDTYLSRSGVNTLYTPGAVTIGGIIAAGNHVNIAGNINLSGYFWFNPADTALQRGGVNVINHYSGAWGQFQAGVYTVQSDRKTKTAIKPVTEPLHEKLLGAGIYTYQRDATKKRHLGLMADELPPGVVTLAKDPEGGSDLEFVDLYSLIAALLSTVQHLDGRLKALEA